MTNTEYRIKVEWGYYAGTYNAPKDGCLMDSPQYDSRTGREYSEPLTFDSIREAFDHLTQPHDGFTRGTGCEYDGSGVFSMPGTYRAAHGQHSRPYFQIVSRTSGRRNKEIVAACDAIAAESAR